MIFLAAALGGATAAVDCAPQYNFEITTASTFEMASPTPSNLLMTGRLSLKPVTLNHGYWWAIKADNVLLKSQGVTANETSYEVPFAFQVNSQGDIEAFWFSNNVNKSEQDKLKGLAYYFQFAQPTGNKIRVESDALGRYRVQYRHEEAKLLFTKTSYLLSDSVKGSAFRSVDLLESDHQLMPSTCWFEKREGKEALNFLGHSAELDFSVSQQYVLTKASRIVDSKLFALPNDLSLWPDAKPVDLTQKQREAMQNALRAYLTDANILALDGYSLAQQLRHYDQVIAVLPELFDSLSLSDEAQMRVFNALGQLDTPSAQHAITIFLSTEQSTDTHFRALRALANGTSALGDDAWNTIKLLIDDPNVLADLKGSFIMTLGVVLGARDEGPHTNELKTELQNALVMSVDETSQSHAITAMGNSGKTEFVSVLENWNDSDSTRVRKSVARALGRLNSEASYKVLVTMAGRDESLAVQSAVLTSLADYDIDEKLRQDVLKFAKNSESDKVRYAAIQALATQRYDERDKELRSLLGQETSRRNFTAIVKALHP